MPEEQTEAWETWRARYVSELVTVLQCIRAEAVEKSRAQSESLHHTLNPWLPRERHKASLSQKALWILASTPGVTCILIGARKAAYVEDAGIIQSWPSFQTAHKVLASLTPTP